MVKMNISTEPVKNTDNVGSQTQDQGLRGKSFSQIDLLRETEERIFKDSLCCQ